MARVHPYQPAPGILEVRLDMLLGGQNVNNVFHVQKGTSIWNETDMDTIAGIFQTYFVDHASSNMSSALTLVGKTLVDLTSLNGIRKVYGEDTPPAGNLTGDALPANVTFAIKLNAQNRGRGVNGRIFWPGLAEAQVAGNQLNSADADAIKGHIDWLIGQIISAGPAGAVLCVLSKWENGVWRASGIGREVTSATYSDLTIDTQKLRLPNHRKAKKKVVTP